METFAAFLEQIADPAQRARTYEVLSWTARTYPRLERKIAWKQPMFTDHGTFIIAFSVAKHHLAVAPERAGIEHFSQQIMQAGYDHTQQLLRIRWTLPVDYGLLGRMIAFNIADKKDCGTFWRKASGQASGAA
jgi:uncharacterized protein YdhG (YjbR/CyaY superfamily)